MNDTEYYIDIPSFYPGSALFMILGVISFGGNGVLIWMHISKPSLRQDLHLIPALAVVDFVAGFADFGQAVVPLLPPYTASQSQCALLIYPLLFVVVVIPIYTFLLSFSRMIAFKMPILYAKLRNRKFVVFLHTVVFSVGVVPLVYTYSFTKSDVYMWFCQTAPFDPKWTSPARILNAIIMSTGLIGVNTILWLAVKKRKEEATKLTRTFGPSNIRDEKLAKSLIIISTVYVATFVMCALIFGISQEIADPGKRKFYAWYAGVFSAINSAVNIFIYCWRSQEYRDALPFRRVTTKTIVVSILAQQRKNSMAIINTLRKPVQLDKF